MSLGPLQLAVIVGLVVLLFGSKHLGQIGWQLGRLVRKVRAGEGSAGAGSAGAGSAGAGSAEIGSAGTGSGEGDVVQAVQTARKLARISRGGFPWLK